MVSLGLLCVPAVHHLLPPTTGVLAEAMAVDGHVIGDDGERRLDKYGIPMEVSGEGATPPSRRRVRSGLVREDGRLQPPHRERPDGAGGRREWVWVRPAGQGLVRSRRQATSTRPHAR
jgi:hypothetical protein